VLGNRPGPLASARLPRQSARHGFFDHVAVATIIQFYVDKPKNTKATQAAVKLFISQSPRSCGFRFVASLSKNRPTLNQWLRLIAVGRSGE
jgi:hypothetical protein